MRSQGRARRPEIALTKRRAVDFCRVATAICPAAQPSRMR
ncbi:MAG: putative leader peptide [Streptosporangiaceae bacterium]